MSGGFLIIEDEVALARSLARTVDDRSRSTCVHTLADAGAALDADGPWVGLILDLILPDGYGLDFLEEVREGHPSLPVLVLTGELDRDVVNRVQALDADYVCKPAGHENLDLFIRRALARGTVQPADLDRRVERLAESLALTHREKELVSLSIRGLSRRELATTMGVAENTVKAQIRGLLKKTGDRSIAALAQRVLRG
jgi:DNA-binding NarL/FixJ family response regulator